MKRIKKLQKTLAVLAVAGYMGFAVLGLVVRLVGKKV